MNCFLNIGQVMGRTSPAELEQSLMSERWLSAPGQFNAWFRRGHTTNFPLGTTDRLVSLLQRKEVTLSQLVTRDNPYPHLGIYFTNVWLPIKVTAPRIVELTSGTKVHVGSIHGLLDELYVLRDLLCKELQSEHFFREDELSRAIESTVFGEALWATWSSFLAAATLAMKEGVALTGYEKHLA